MQASTDTPTGTLKSGVPLEPDLLWLRDQVEVRELLEVLQEGAYIVDREFRIRAWNSGAGQISGYSMSAVNGQRCCDDILVHVDEAGAPMCKTGCPLKQTLSDGASREEILYLRHRLGHRVAVRIRTAALRDREGSVMGAIEAFVPEVARVEFQKLLHELEGLAFTDALTNLPNRRCLDRQLEVFRREHTNSGVAFGFLLIDIDHFKSINDRYGHDAGDLVLRQVAHTLTNAVRSTDFVARWGGEEFGILLPVATVGTVRRAAERCRALVEQMTIPIEGVAEVRVTVSVGGAVACEGESNRNLLNRVDAELYRAKRSGRNAVSIACAERIG